MLQLLTEETMGGRGGAKAAMWKVAERRDAEEIHLIVRTRARQQRRARQFYEKMGFQAVWKRAWREYRPKGGGGEDGEEEYMVATTEEVRRALEGELVDGGLEVTEGSRCRQ